MMKFVRIQTYFVAAAAVVVVVVVDKIIVCHIIFLGSLYLTFFLSSSESN